MTAARNIVVVLAIAALVVLIPGGGTGATVAVQAVSLTFLATMAWFASLMYRQHRVALYSLGDRRRATLYASAVVITLTLTASSRLWHTGAGIVIWFALVGGAAYAGIAVIWAAREY